MDLKVGQKRKLDLNCIRASDPTKEVKLPVEFTFVTWSSSDPSIVSIDTPKGFNCEVTALKKGNALVSAISYKKTNQTTFHHEVFSSSVKVFVSDDSKPDVAKSDVLSIVIKEK